MNNFLKFNFSKIVNGRQLQRQILQKLDFKIKQNINIIKRKPSLALILIGQDKASKIYVNKKIDMCKAIGIDYQFNTFSENVQEQEVIDYIDVLNQDKNIDSIMVQLPIPKQINYRNILKSIDQKKDVDCLEPSNYSRFLLEGEKSKIIPCTAKATLYILDQHKIDVKGLNTVIIGCSELVGFPISLLLLKRNATITICHEYTKQIEKHIQNADLLISATGKFKINSDWIKKDSIVIDIGFCLENDKIKGDIDFETAVQKTQLITPVPGGIGPLTCSFLLENIIDQWIANNKITIQ